MVDATTEQNNNKEAKDAKRVFMLFQGSEEYPNLKTFEYDSESKELIIRFVYDIPGDKKNQKAYDELNYNAITEYLIREHKEKIAVLLAVVSSDKKKQTTLMQKHLNAYVAKNTFDYFIHKDLGGFLRRELDFYIKNEIMHLDDLDTDNERSVETYLAKIKAVKRVGNVIIDFLAQIENFQKKLWLKKKFVVETNWCMTLDKVDEKFYPEIIANPEQIQEWIESGRPTPPAPVKGKVVESAYFQIPLVTTSIGAEGIDATMGNMLVIDDPDQMAKEICRIYKDPALLRKMSDAGKDLIKKYYTLEEAERVLNLDF